MKGDVSDHSRAAHRHNCEITEGGMLEGELQAVAEGDAGLLGFDNDDDEDRGCERWRSFQPGPRLRREVTWQ